MPFSIVAGSLLSIFAMTLPGFFLTKAKLLNKKSTTTITNLLIYVISPLLIFVSFQNQECTSEMLHNICITVLIAFLYFLIASLAVIFIIKPKTAKDIKKILGYGSIMPNAGFIGIPLFQVLFPNNPEPIIYCAIYSAMFMLFTWSFGSYIISGNKKHISAKKALLNPTAISLYISIPLFIFGIKLIDYTPHIYHAISLVASCNSPLAMTILGITLAYSSLKEVFANKDIYIGTLLKLIIVPLTCFGILSIFRNLINEQIFGTSFMMTAMPTGVMTVVFSEKLLNKGKDASALFVVTTLLSIITIPILLMLAY